MYERAPITLPPPLPPMALRFTISAAYAICAFGIAPFILVGLLIRCLGVPLAAVIDRFSKPKSGRRPRGSAGRRDRAHQPPAAAAPAPATPTVTAPSPRRQLSSASIYSTKSSSSSAASIRRAEGRAASEAVNGDELSPAQAYAAAARGTSAPPGAERKASSSSSLWRR